MVAISLESLSLNKNLEKHFLFVDFDLCIMFSTHMKASGQPRQTNRFWGEGTWAGSRIGRGEWGWGGEVGKGREREQLKIQSFKTDLH